MKVLVWNPSTVPGRDRWIHGTYWQANIAYPVSFRSVREPVSKKGGQYLRKAPDFSSHLHPHLREYAGDPHAQVHWYIHTPTYIHIQKKTEKEKEKRKVSQAEGIARHKS